MATYKLLESATNSVGGKYYVRIESNFPSQVYLANIRNIQFTECLHASSPMMTLDFMDTVGSLTNLSFLSPEITYNAYLGRDPTNVAGPFPFSLSGHTQQQTQAGDVAQVASQPAFLSSAWIKLMTVVKSRSWNNMSISDVVTDILEECGFLKVVVERTPAKQTIVQPNWSNYQMLKWLAPRAVNVNGDSAYDFVAGMDGSFIFQSHNTFLNQAPFTTLYLKGRGATNINIYGVKFKNKFMEKTNRSPALGVHSSYFDYHKGAFVTADTNITQVNQAQLSDWTSIPNDLIQVAFTFHNGQDVNTQTVVKSIITTATKDVTQLEFQMLGNHRLKVGQVVNIVMNTGEHVTNSVNEFFSGYWLVDGITHVVDMANTVFNTKVHVARAGMNGTNITNMAKTATGKKLVAVTPTSTSIISD